jgi:hypothetical protein
MFEVMCRVNDPTTGNEVFRDEKEVKVLEGLYP